MTSVPDIDFCRFSDKETFASSVIMRLSDMLCTLVGPDQTEAAIAMVGNWLADDLAGEFTKDRPEDSATPQEVAEVLVELKRRIGGDFSVVSADQDKIVLHNTRCPFGERVEGRPTLCNMTQHVFGNIVRHGLGDNEVHIPRSIGKGDRHCRVVIQLTAPKE